MNRLLRGLSGLIVCSALCIAQGPARTKGTIFKDDVDRLINLIRTAARQSDVPALGGNSVVATAKVLTAMAHCHRRYHKSDGPVVQPSIDFLIKNRKENGSFGDALATAWAIDALRSIDPDGFKDEIATALAALPAGTEAGFDSVVSRVLAAVRPDTFPQHLGEVAQKQARAWWDAPETLDRAKAPDVLLELVACQAANTLLDTQKPQEPKSAPAAAPATFSPAQQKAHAWVWMQGKDGVFAEEDEASAAAMTAFGLLALQTKPAAMRTPAEQAAIEKGLRWLLDRQQPDGTFGEPLPNYTTCVAVGALARWDNPAVPGALAKAQRAILGFQNAESTGYTRSDRDYGSIGYGNAQRGDLSNLHFAIGALRDTGLPANNEAFAKAVIFLQRTQNLKATNDFAAKVPHPDKPGQLIEATSGDDGGAAYYPGNSAAGYIVQPDGKAVPRSYGSMTYALLKSYTLAGVPGDDPRVQAAVKWLAENWTLETNPGSDPQAEEKVKFQGLYYYYMVMAQALTAAGVDRLKVQGSGGAHEIDWREELRAHLEKVQQPDGTWVNGKNGRWMEDSAFLCTCYALTTLELCR